LFLILKTTHNPKFQQKHLGLFKLKYCYFIKINNNSRPVLNTYNKQPQESFGSNHNLQNQLSWGLLYKKVI
jgi:hypothetical protein